MSQEMKASITAETKGMDKAAADLKKVDDAQVRETERARGELVEAKLKGAKLPESAVTELFRKNLAAAEDEAGVDALIADRKAVVDEATKTSGPVLPERDLTAALTVEDNGKFKDVDESTFGRAYDMFA